MFQIQEIGVCRAVARVDSGQWIVDSCGIPFGDNLKNAYRLNSANRQIGVCLDKVVIPSGAKRSRGIYAFCYAFWSTWCEDPSTTLRFAQDNSIFEMIETVRQTPIFLLMKSDRLN